MIVDLQNQLQFPQDIVETGLRPDIVLLSRSMKQLVLIELTVPWEERTEEAHEKRDLNLNCLLNSVEQRDDQQDVTQ